LSLRNNRIEKLGAYAFRGLVNLEYFNLKKYTIKQIDKKAFVGLPTYVEIIIGYSFYTDENNLHLF